MRHPGHFIWLLNLYLHAELFGIHSLYAAIHIKILLSWFPPTRTYALFTYPRMFFSPISTSLVVLFAFWPYSYPLQMALLLAPTNMHAQRPRFMHPLLALTRS